MSDQSTARPGDVASLRAKLIEKIDAADEHTLLIPQETRHLLAAVRGVLARNPPSVGPFLADVLAELGAVMLEG